MAGVKLLISGVERSGKTTMASKLKDALVISFDVKKYPFKVPHVNVSHYNGFGSLEELIGDKLTAYQDKFGEFPKTIVLDTVTQFYTSLQKYALDRYSGFDIHSVINKDTLALNAYIEDVLIENGCNVVIIAHTQYDEGAKRYIIPASGAFAKSGSWLSVVDEAVYIGLKGAKFVAYHKELKYPCRSTIEELPDSEPVESYDINAHLQKLIDKSSHNEEFEL